MNQVSLFVTTLLTWVAVVAGIREQNLEMRNRAIHTPASFPLGQKGRIRHILQILFLPIFIIFAGAALALHWQSMNARTHIIGAAICVGLSSLLKSIYLKKKVSIVAQMPTDASESPEYTKKVRLLIRWLTIQNVIRLFAALFLTIAYLHS